ncbi:MAG: DUF2007 domain-containing protein [Bryobacteraceae bacterium]|jgi:hypothetical protein
MAVQSDSVTVYRSMDPSAEEDCRAIFNTLTSAGVPAVLLDDKTRGVPEGVWEVQVAAADAERADQIVAANPPPGADVDPSHELDLVPIYQSGTPLVGAIEVMGIKALLEANGIMAVSTGDSVQPELPFTLSVPRDQVDQAKQLIAEAQATGPADADAGEAETDSEPRP